MKLIAYTLLLFSNLCWCQNWQSTSLFNNGGGQRFDDVFFLDENTGWAANGFFAAVYKTTDGGETWQTQLTESDLGGAFYFRNIEFLDDQNGFLGTLNNLLLKTTDGGNTWLPVDNITPNPNAVCGLSALNAQTIFGCGAFFQPAFIIKSIDAGQTWTYTNMSDLATALVEIKFIDETTGYAGGQNAGGACLLKTTDGGNTWIEVYNSGIPGEYVWKIQILDNPNVVFGAVSSVAPHLGKLIKSFDAGNSWQSFDAPETNIQALGFISETKGWMGGHTTGFYETNDGGQTWTNTGIGNNLNRIIVLNTGLAYGCGTSVYKYSDTSLSIVDDEIKGKNVLDVTLKDNPVKSSLEFSVTFDSADNLVIEIYDLSGKFIQQLSRDIVNSKQIKSYSFNVDHLASGSYFLNFHSNTGRQSFKFIKQ
ncbi:T9SS type A sorting domain-containing protein [Paucihalobacter ruber]|uniref:T9SS type A sorting domain-containing protein n=1 Tax=Paucihalobacter ruber TaxID=2567861 RepID=A0A506PLC9_9FLAO|nr:YCF48-related protein [Paucihalobacter ruber]TPV34115.1 T9SS type A sorting domain-containing protein [Paucihalobacter ruber]